MASRALWFSTTMLSGVVGATFFAALPARAADLLYKGPYANADVPLSGPAVDGFTSKIDTFGGVLSDKGIFGVRGSFSFPVGVQYGLQFDGTAGSYAGEFFGALGAHLFWRDPGRGLIGIYFSHTYWDHFGGLYASHVAAEGEYYSGRWTVQGIVGVEFGNSKSAIIGPILESYDVQTRFFDMINVNYYVQDNMRVFLGHRYTGGKNALALGGEWGFALAPKTMGTVFLEGRIGEGNYQGVWGGFRVYFGQREKTLIQRNRQDDDPLNWSPDTLSTIRNTFKSQNAPSQCPPGYTYIQGEGCVLIPS